MIKIGMIGSDNSHALAFSKLANVDRVLGDRAQVVGIWGAEAERTAEVAREAAIPTIVAQPADLLGEVDLAIVVDRHGGLHAEHALPFIERGLPTFIDKPFAISLDDCRRMLDAAERSGAPVSSFSALRYAPADELASKAAGIGTVASGLFAGPCDPDSQYGGLFFYATHPIEIALRLLGDDARVVSAHRSGGTVNALLEWGSGATIAFAFMRDAEYHFHATLFGTSGFVAQEITGGDAAYTDSLTRIVTMAETRESPLTPAELLRPIELVQGIVELLG
jgi:predicted dehydrogenase